MALRGTLRTLSRAATKTVQKFHQAVCTTARDALIEAVYRAEVEKLGPKRDFAEAVPPPQALRAWMLLFVDHIAAKQIIAPALNTLVGDPSKLYEGSRGQIWGAIDALAVTDQSLERSPLLITVSQHQITSVGRICPNPDHHFP